MKIEAVDNMGRLTQPREQPHAMMFVALAMFVRIFGKQGFVVAAFNQADQFCRTFRAFYLVAG